MVISLVQAHHHAGLQPQEGPQGPDQQVQQYCHKFNRTAENLDDFLFFVTPNTQSLKCMYIQYLNTFKVTVLYHFRIPQFFHHFILSVVIFHERKKTDIFANSQRFSHIFQI